MGVWLGIVLGERSFFRENERNYKELSHHFKKRTNIQNPFLKILELLLKERTGTNGNCLKRTLKSGMSSYHQERVLSRILNQECAGTLKGGGLIITSGDLLKKPLILDFGGSTFKTFHYLHNSFSKSIYPGKTQVLTKKVSL